MHDSSSDPTPTPRPIPPDDLSRGLALARPDDDSALPHLGLVGDTYTILLTGRDTAGRYTLIDMHVPPTGGPPPHRHDFEEMFTVLEGRYNSPSAAQNRSCAPARPSTCQPTHRTASATSTTGQHGCSACARPPAPGYLGRVATPNLDALAGRGAFALAHSTFHTISNPARASMSSGAYPQRQARRSRGRGPPTVRLHRRHACGRRAARSARQHGRDERAALPRRRRNPARHPASADLASSTSRRRSPPCSARARRPTHRAAP